jgi:ABC-type sugar transport system ATPase subunit
VTFVPENISLSVGQEAVIDDVSLTLDQGSMNVLLGPTLSGKTTRSCGSWPDWTGRPRDD